MIGLCIGSFLNVAILRIPKGESVTLPASHCVHCLHPLSWYHNIPLLSWLFLRGKCAFCHGSISAQYPIIELLSALLYVCTWMQTEDFIQSLLLGTVFALLLALSLIDLRYKAVPDALSLPALMLSFLTTNPLTSLEQGLLFMGGFTFLRFGLSYVLKKEVMGEADIIIAGIIGALLGIKLGLLAIYLSAVIALFAFMVVRKKGYELPFIPFLSAGLFIVWFWSDSALMLLGKLYE
jgi:leader peptidase (prepilin peptidase)/N-methyltransferase